jgi:monoamine oxidase
VIECVYEFWGRDPYGAGYHNFLSGYYVPAVMKTMRKPWMDQTIYIVGEAFSNETGWVEGAYQTTELLLQSEYKLPQLVPNYYAGY